MLLGIIQFLVICMLCLLLFGRKMGTHYRVQDSKYSLFMIKVSPYSSQSTFKIKKEWYHH